MPFTIKLNNKTLQFEKKVRLSSLIEDEEKQYFIAKVNNRLRELSYEVYYDAEVTFLTIKDREAVRVYETSLRYLFAMTAHRLYPNLKFRFSYNVSRSIFVQILNEGLRVDSTMVKNISEEMRKIIEQDLPFERKIVSNDDAVEIYKQWGFEDKIELIKYRPEKTVHFYSCDGYMNYMYGYMVPSTGYLKRFSLRLYSPGIIIQYPRSECNGNIPPFEDAPTFGKTLKESHKWAKATGVDFVAGLNKMVENGGDIEFINLCEAKHNRMLCDLGQLIENDIDNIRIICIAGPSSSGKTTFANRLRIELMSRGIKPIRISMDDYYLPRELAPLDENGEPDLESINALDIPLFNQNMLDLIQGEEVQLPKFDFKLGKRVPGRVLKVPVDQPIIIEGIHALNDQMTTLIPKHQKFKIYIAPQAQINLDNHNPISLTDLRLLRRIVRDKQFRNASAESTMQMWPSVRKGEFTWIYKTQEGADYVYNSFLPYELCVMRKYALPVLQKIDIYSPYFSTAERLIKFLKYFVEMDDKWVPCNSLMREFIGGSCYHDI